jgi:peptidyl-prolyl cis-trans isomerase C
MTDDLNFTLPEAERPPQPTSRVLLLLMVLVLIIGLVNVFLLMKQNDKSVVSSSAVSLSQESLKELALKLEKQTLRSSAINAWKEYISSVDLDSIRRAKIWYRIGRLYQEDERPEQALEAYYRAESLASLPDLERDLNLAVQECLDQLGKLSVLQHELADRVAVFKGEDRSGNQILAEIGPLKISRADLSQYLEDQVDDQLEAMASFLPEEQRKVQKEELLKRFSADSQKMQILNQLILEEILYRQAREDKLVEDPGVRRLIRKAERGILAAKVMEKELKDQIKITAGDVETYYKANQSDYEQPEQAEISHIMVDDEQSAQSILDKIKDGQDFLELVQEYSTDSGTKAEGGKVAEPVMRGTIIPAFGETEGIDRAIFSTAAGEVVDQVIKSSKGYHIIKVRSRREKRQKELKEVQSEVYRTLRGKKESEVQQALLSKLKDKYDVVVHLSRLKMKNPEETEKDG